MLKNKWKKTESFSKEIEDKKNQIEISEIKRWIFFFNWWIGSTPEWGAQSKEKANLKKLKQKLFNLIKSKMTDWKQRNKIESLRNMWGFHFCHLCHQSPGKIEEKGGAENIHEHWPQNFQHLARSNLTDSRSWTNAKQNKIRINIKTHHLSKFWKLKIKNIFLKV